jgi:hypothetical protein
VGKSVGLSLTGGWSTGAWRAVVCGVGRLVVAAEGLAGCVATAIQCSVADDAAASSDARDFHRSGAGSSSGEGSPWAEQEVLAGSLAGRTSTITTPPEVLARRSGDLRPRSAGGTASVRGRSQLRP